VEGLGFLYESVSMSQSCHIKNNIYADRPCNRRVRRAGTGKQLADALFPEWSIWTARYGALPETARRDRNPGYHPLD
jgi:hypothetical protein